MCGILVCKEMSRYVANAAFLGVKEARFWDSRGSARNRVLFIYARGGAARSNRSNPDEAWE